MKQPDQSQRFLFDDLPIRGQYVTLDESWQAIARQAGLQGRGLSLLGEALAAVVLLVDTLKISGTVTLQIRGTGPLGLLVVEADSAQKIRGVARQKGDIADDMNMQQIFGSDYLVVTIKTEGAEPHQGIAPLQGDNLAEALEHYFATSEQLPTRFWLACDQQSVSGMLIQKLPGEITDADAWDRVTHLAATVSGEELKQVPLDELLYRLFNQDTIRLFEPKTIEFFCSCSRERTSGMLLALGKTEVMDIVESEGEVEVTCEFCNEQYRFDRIDVEQLFLTGGAAPSNGTNMREH